MVLFMKEKARHDYLWQKRVMLSGSNPGFLFHRVTFRYIWKEMAAFNLIPGLYPSADNASGHGLCYSASHGNGQYCSASMRFRRSACPQSPSAQIVVTSDTSLWTLFLYKITVKAFLPYTNNEAEYIFQQERVPSKYHRKSSAGKQSHWKGIPSDHNCYFSDMVTRIRKVTLDCPNK